MDLRKLKELSLAATPGPWHAQDQHADNGEFSHIGVEASDGMEIIGEDIWPGSVDTRFIAAANPATILELIALVERQEAELRARATAGDQPAPSAPSVTVDTPDKFCEHCGMPKVLHNRDCIKSTDNLPTYTFGDGFVYYRKADIDAHTAQAVADAFEAGKRLAHAQACKVTHALMEERDAARRQLAALKAQPQPAQAALSDDADAEFLAFCDRQGYPSDSEIDAAIRDAFDEGIRFASQQPAAALTEDAGDSYAQGRADGLTEAAKICGAELEYPGETAGIDGSLHAAIAAIHAASQQPSAEPTEQPHAADNDLIAAEDKGYASGLRVGLLEGASILREVYVNHGFHTGLKGLEDRCKEAEQVLIAKADAECPAQQPSAEPMAIAEPMPGSSGFTIAVFKAVDVPVGTKVFITPPAPARQANEWQEAERIRDLPLVDEVLQGFADDRTGDNAAMVVREVMRAVAPPAPAQQAAAAMTVEMSQFLTDVVTAAGLLAYGKTDKKLAKRISKFAFSQRQNHLPAQQDAKPLTDRQIAIVCEALGQFSRFTINNNDAATAERLQSFFAAAKGGAK